MTEKDTMRSWVSLRDYVVKGVRQEMRFVDSVVMDPSMPPLPETWVSARDYWVNHVHKAKSTEKMEDSVDDSKPSQQTEGSYPEARLTVYHALAEVYTALEKSAISLKVTQMQAFNLQDVDSGIITNEEHQRRDTTLYEIKDGHLAKMDDMASWYLDTFFRVFESGS